MNIDAKAYDEAPTMSAGHLSGVEARIQAESSVAVFNMKITD